jgi:hypothetical protein
LDDFDLLAVELDLLAVDFDLLVEDFEECVDLLECGGLADDLVDVVAGACFVVAAAMVAISKITQNELSALVWVPRSDNKLHLGNRELPNPYVYQLGRAELQST